MERAIMAKINVGNHSAVRVRRSDRDKIRAFYRDVLGASMTGESDFADDFRIGDGFYVAFCYGAVPGTPTENALDDGDFAKAIYLELKADNVEEMRKAIVASGVKVFDVPDPHLYFQAPGGQVWRLVGADEDLSKYEGNRFARR
jgi:catechol 2,3-dioxygenase-like lactoylglutathione lyase family enzyme